MVVNDFNAKQSARYSRVLVVTELVLSGTQCIDLLNLRPFQSKWLSIPTTKIFTSVQLF